MSERLGRHASGRTPDGCADVLGHHDTGTQVACHGAEAAQAAAPTTALLATAMHAAGYLIVTAVIALVVFEKFGLDLLRKAWFNFDLAWAATLTVTGPMSACLSAA